MKIRIYCLFFICPSFLFAGEFCELQPDGFDGSKASILAFEKNIENKISEIYRTQYPLVIQKLTALEELQKKLKDFESQYKHKYVKVAPKHPKSSSVNALRKRKRREAFLHLVEQNISSEAELNEYLKKMKVIRQMPFRAYRAYVDTVNELKNKIQEINTSLLEIQSFGFLQLPDFGFSLEGSKAYGYLKMEGLFRMPKDDLLKLPFLKIGFETNSNTVIYSCVHLDEFNSERNRIYIYFLNTTKIYNFHWKDFFMRPSLAFQHLLTFRQEPKAVISPLPFVLNPLSSTSGTLNTLNQFQQLNNHPAFNQIMSTVGQFDFLNFSLNLHPILKVIKNNVQVGVKGFMIQPDRLQIRYSGTALYGLINFNLAVHNQSADFSSFMNMMTLDDL